MADKAIPERQLRQLTQVPEEERKRIWDEATVKAQEAGEKLTAKRVKEAACERAGLDYKQAQDYGRVGDRFKTPDRSGICGFKHHRLLAIDALSTEQRAHLLAQAEHSGWSSARLVKERDKLLGKPEKIPLTDFDEKVDKVLESLPKTATNKLNQGACLFRHRQIRR